LAESIYYQGQVSLLSTKDVPVYWKEE
jgi:hypothetical protein